MFITTADSTIELSYNSSGMRTQKTVDGTETNYYYDSDNNLVGMTANGKTMLFYYDADGSVTSFKYNGNMYYYVKNLQGDIVKIINQSGVVYASYVYDAWGNIQSETGQPIVRRLNPFRYRGYVYDEETGLYYLQSRYYDPETGRFLNADVYCDTETGSPLSTNMYTYCENDPVNKYDPTGLFSIPRGVISFVIDAMVWTLSGGMSSIIAAITQPIKSIARRFGVAMIKSYLKGFLKGIVKKLNKVIYAVAKFITSVVQKFIKKWTAKIIAGKIAGGLSSLATNSFLKVIAPNIDVFLSIGGLIAGIWDWYSDKKLNGWIKLW